MAFQIKDIFSYLYKITFDLLFYTTIFCILLGLLPDNLFEDFPMKPIQYDNDHLYKELENIKWNDKLVTDAKLIGLKPYFGAESLVEIGDYIYSGVLGGKIIRIHKSTEKIEEVLRYNNSEECRDKHVLKSGKCGRFLGVRENKGDLYALEADTGLYRIDLKTNKMTHLTKNLQNDYPLAIFNDFVFDPKIPDLVYISVSSIRWSLDRIGWSIVEHDTSGLVLAYNLAKNEYVKISDGHALSNGIEITADQKYILVAETGSFAIKKIDLKNAQEIFSTQKTLDAGKLELFGQLLPGEADNIRVDPKNGDIWVGMFTVRPDKKVLRDYLAQWPFIRKSFARTAYFFYILFDKLEKTFGITNHAILQYRDDLYTGHIIYKIIPEKDGAIIRLDAKTGLPKAVYGSSKFFGVSEAIVDSKGDLYFGSFRHPFIGRISLQKLINN